MLMAEVTGVDTAARLVQTSAGPMPYDYLVLATGAIHSYFGHDEWDRGRAGPEAHRGRDPHSPHAFCRLRAGRAHARRRRAAAPAHLRHRRRRRHRRRDGGRDRRDRAPDAGQGFPADRPAHLPHHPARSRARACCPPCRRICRTTPRARSTRMGVEVRTSTRVTNCDPGGVDLEHGRIDAGTIIWAAGRGCFAGGALARRRA